MDLDDSLEHRRRCKFSLVLGLPLGVAGGLTLFSSEIQSYTSTGLWSCCLPLVLTAMSLIYWVLPHRGGRLGSAAHGAPPRLLRPGNPVLRQSSQAGSILLSMFLLSFVGCIGLVTTCDDMTGWGMFAMYAGLAVLFTILMSQTQWLELDVDSLHIFRHRVTYGLQRTTAQNKQAVRALAACRTASMVNYNVFAFTQDGNSLPISRDRSDLKEVQFEAERLADQLMVPLLVGVEQQNNLHLARSIRGRKDEALPLRRDWRPTRMPDELAGHRSTFPPID